MGHQNNSQNPNTFNFNISGGDIKNLVGSGSIRYSEGHKHVEGSPQDTSDNSLDNSLEPAVKPVTILFLAANPVDTPRARLGEEARDIREGLERSAQRERFVLKERWATNVRNISRALLEVKPNIVHFSGRSAGVEGLVLEDNAGSVHTFKADALADLFSLFSSCVECVVLNACYSQVQAEEISKHIPYVIGMNSAVDDKSAVDFAVGLYDAIGNGRSIEFAYEFSKRTLFLLDADSKVEPVLITSPR